MKTPPRILVLFLLLGSLFSSCKKNNEVDAIDQRIPYLGSYDPVQYSAYTDVNTTRFSNDQSRGALTVSKSPSANDELLITIQFPAYTEQLTAKLNGSKFTIVSKNTEVLVWGSNNYNANYVGSGEFTADNNIIYQFTVKTTQGDLTLQKIGSFTGPKKTI